MQIPFHRPSIGKNEINEVCDSLRNGWLTMGHKTISFETRFSDYIGAKHSIAVNSCTAALHLALHCLGLKQGDQVIVPATTFAATAEVVRYFGAVPVMADIERHTHLVDVKSIEKAITKRTKAILPVHFAGQPADMDEIMALSKKAGISVIEDAAHSLPARYRNRMIGTIGHATCFSFYATKTITTGEGGMITTSLEKLADKARILRLHGISRDAWKRYTDEGTWKYDVIEAGFKYNMTDINAAIGIHQLNRADVMNKKRWAIADRYHKAFRSSDGIILYEVKDDRDCSWQLYPLKLRLEALKIGRDEFILELKKRGIGTSVHFIPLYRFSYYRKLGYKAVEYPASEWVFKRVISLPIYPDMKKVESDYVIDAVLDLIRHKKR